MPDQPGHHEVVLRGVIADLRPGRGAHPHLQWRVILAVESVVSGKFPDERLVFHIHSPEKAGIVAGGRYEIGIAVQDDGRIVLTGVRRLAGDPAQDHQPG